MKICIRICASFVALAFVLSFSSPAAAGLDPEVKCEAKKLKAMGKYLSCLMKDEAKTAIKGPQDPPDLGGDKCAAKLATDISKLEDKLGADCGNVQAAAVYDAAYRQKVTTSVRVPLVTDCCDGGSFCFADEQSDGFGDATADCFTGLGLPADGGCGGDGVCGSGAPGGCCLGLGLGICSQVGLAGCESVGGVYEASAVCVPGGCMAVP